MEKSQVISKFNDLPLDTIIHYENALNEISPHGRELIEQLIYRYGMRLSPDFDWSNEPKSARISRRVSKDIYRNYDQKLPPDVLTEIGNIYDQNSNQVQKFAFDFTRDFYWERGEFGDHKSCFWTDKLASRLQLERTSTLAMRFYDDMGKGYSRAWILPQGDSIVVLNAYGKGMTVNRIGTIFATYIGETNFGQTMAAGGSGFFINSNTAFIIGDLYSRALLEQKENRNDQPMVYLNLPRIERVGYCDKCGFLTDEFISIRHAIGINTCRYRCAKHKV